MCVAGRVPKLLSKSVFLDLRNQLRTARALEIWEQTQPSSTTPTQYWRHTEDGGRQTQISQPRGSPVALIEQGRIMLNQRNCTGDVTGENLTRKRRGNSQVEEVIRHSGICYGSELFQGPGANYSMPKTEDGKSRSHHPEVLPGL